MTDQPGQRSSYCTARHIAQHGLHAADPEEYSIQIESLSIINVVWSWLIEVSFDFATLHIDDICDVMLASVSDLSSMVDRGQHHH